LKEEYFDLNSNRDEGSCGVTEYDTIAMELLNFYRTIGYQ